VITILGEDEPGVFDGLPAERVAQDSLLGVGKVSWYVRAVMRGARRWVGMGWPTPFWASQVFPELSADEAQRRLLEELMWFCRLGPQDPPGFDGWRTHVDTLAVRAQTLTDLRLDRLELRGPGTELTVRLAPEGRWLGGQEENAQGVMLASNIPTEENFTSPDPAGTEGTFRCSRPLDFRGRTIDGIAGELRGGRLVRLEASTDDDRDFLAAHLHGDRNADRLGEVALVDSTSRIGSTGRVYSNTLLDENAVAHIAFGAGFGQTRTNGGRRVNKANLHLDVMIGTDDFEATGYADGRTVPLIRDGLWQI
jgi:aminopeptidase